MNNRIRFHLDENVNPVIAQALRQYGIDVTTSIEVRVLSKNDEEQLEFALKENRVLVTHDDDFLRMASQSNEHPGIAYCHLEARSIGEIIRALQLIYEVLLPHEIFGQIEYLETFSTTLDLGLLVQFLHSSCGDTGLGNGGLVGGPSRAA